MAGIKFVETIIIEDNAEKVSVSQEIDTSSHSTFTKSRNWRKSNKALRKSYKIKKIKAREYLKNTLKDLTLVHEWKNM